jgi:hypothetical protein
MVISSLLDVSVSGRIRTFAAHLLDVRERRKSTSLNFFAGSRRLGKPVSRTKLFKQKVSLNSNYTAQLQTFVAGRSGSETGN